MRKRNVRSLALGERSRTSTGIMRGSSPRRPEIVVARSWSIVPTASRAAAIFQETCRLGKTE